MISTSIGHQHFTGVTLYVHGIRRPFKFLIKAPYTDENVRSLCHTVNASCENLPEGMIFNGADISRLCCVRRNMETRKYLCPNHCSVRPSNGFTYMSLASKETYLDRVPTHLIQLITKFMCHGNSLPFDAPRPNTAAPYCQMCVAVTNQLLHSCNAKGAKRAWNLEEASQLSIGEKRRVICDLTKS